MTRRFAAITIAILIFACTPLLFGQAAQIDKVSPSEGRPGDVVTIDGNGFGAFNVRVSVGGRPAAVIAANGQRVSFRVPPTAPSGPTEITAVNPGGRAGAFPFRILEGTLLPGAPQSSALDAASDLRELPAPLADVDNAVFLTRLVIRVSRTATVGQVNAALALVHGGIIGMAPHLQWLTVAIPRQPDRAGVQAIVDQLRLQPGIDFAKPGRGLQVTSFGQGIPAGAADLTANAHLAPGRFAQAWNARHLIVNGLGQCQRSDGTPIARLPVLIPDKYGSPPAPFATEIPTFPSIAPVSDPDGTHGYEMAEVVGAGFGGTALVGANPFADCLTFTPVQMSGVTDSGQVAAIANALPFGKFVLNFSMAWGDDCLGRTPEGALEDDCAIDDPTFTSPVARADAAWEWKKLTAGRWSDFLAAASAGNSRDAASAAIYAGMGDARFASFLSVAAMGDPLYSFIASTSLWNPAAGHAGYLPLASSAQEAALVAAQVEADGFGTSVAPNVLVVGGTSTNDAATLSAIGTEPNVNEMSFSKSGPDVKAVAQKIGGDLFKCGTDDLIGGVLTFVPTDCNGNSFAAPQVAGLASYLWLLSPELRSAPASVTRDLIRDTAQHSSENLIDAYEAVLSLDAASLPTPATAPIRLALLDVNDDGRFDQADVEAFLQHLLDASGHPVNPTTADFGRFDLNGDGFTGGIGELPFDLDRMGSHQFGAASITAAVTQNIEGNTATYNESHLNDVEILCYYSYSALYTGDVAERSHLLGACGGATVTIDPSGATVKTGRTKQFVATVHGVSDPRVTWTVTGGLNSITATGLLTAGNILGTFTVRATSVADPRAHADATVTVTPLGPPALSGTIVMSRVLDGTFDQEMTAAFVVNVSAIETFTVTQAGGTFVETMMFNDGGCPATELLATRVTGAAITKTGTTVQMGFLLEGTDTQSNLFTGLTPDGHVICGGVLSRSLVSGFSNIVGTIVRTPDGRITALDFDFHASQLWVNDGVHPPKFLHTDITGRLAEEP